METPLPALPGGTLMLPPTPPGATRRTTTLLVTPMGRWATGQRIIGRGRDLTHRVDGSVRTDLTDLSFDIDAAGLIVPSPEGRTVPEALRAHPAQRGLRKKVAAMRASADPGLDVLGPEGGVFETLLDDVVGTSIASGYGHLYETSIQDDSLEEIPLAAARTMTCVGFSTMHAQGEEFHVGRYFEQKPASVEFVSADPMVWHVDPAMAPDSFRRRRMLQVEPTADGALVTGYFRDTFRRPDGVEVVVHEYGLSATVGGPDQVLREIVATPGSLPLDHCPLAARSASRLAGLALSEVESVVRRDIAGPAGCTHLNDELRALRLVPTLLALSR